MTTPLIETRDVPPRTAFALEQAGVHPLLARLFAARGVTRAENSTTRWAPAAAGHPARHAAAAACSPMPSPQQHRICIVADYDCDGATACAVALRGLALLGAAPATLHYVVPDRTVHGYGLTPPIVDLALTKQPQLLVTVDNGIASLEGVAHARAHGLGVLVTDHHLPALVDGVVVLPDANVIVNPNQPGDTFASKALAGVGVMFYVLLALRAELRSRGAFEGRGATRLDALLDLVALGTVADVVKLDANNRRLVAQGLKRIRSGRMQPGIAALFAAAARQPARASAFDFGFALGPRINAAGRLADMTLGIECLVTDDASRAADLAQQLDAINRERREVEAGMREQAEAALEQLMQDNGAGEPPSALALFDPGLPRRRGRHRRRPSEGPAAPPDLRFRARRRRCVERLRPLDPRLSPARRARPGRQAPPRRAAALRRPRDGRRLHDRQGALRHLRSRAATRGRRVARRRHADCGACAPTARWRWSTSTSRPWLCSTRRSGARPSSRRCSATRSTCWRSAWSASGT